MNTVISYLILCYCGFVLGGCVKPEHKFTALAAFIGSMVMTAFIYGAKT